MKTFIVLSILFISSAFFCTRIQAYPTSGLKSNTEAEILKLPSDNIDLPTFYVENAHGNAMNQLEIIDECFSLPCSQHPDTTKNKKNKNKSSDIPLDLDILDDRPDSLVEKSDSINILNIPTSEIDSVLLIKLVRTGINEYDLTGKSYKLSAEEIDSLLMLVKDSTNFYGGTPLMFGFTSALRFYYGDARNEIWIAPESDKILQQDFDIPYNRLESMETLGGAVYFPFIRDNFALFLKALEDKL